jgi:hypothetical protein
MVKVMATVSSRSDFPLIRNLLNVKSNLEFCLQRGAYDAVMPAVAARDVSSPLGE